MSHADEIVKRLRIYIYIVEKMSQILQSDHCKNLEGPGEETELDVNIDFDGELDEQLENAILNATEPLTEE